MVFTFLKARGVNVGNSLVEDDQVRCPYVRVWYLYVLRAVMCCVRCSVHPSLHSNEFLESSCLPSYSLNVLCLYLLVSSDNISPFLILSYISLILPVN